MKKGILSKGLYGITICWINDYFIKEKYFDFSFDKAWPMGVIFKLVWSGLKVVNNTVGQIPMLCRWEKDAGNSVVYACLCNTAKQEEP